MRNNILFKICIAFIALSLSLICIEGVLTVSGYKQKELWWLWATYEYKQSKFVLDRTKIYKLRPNNRIVEDNTVETVDANGFRKQPCTEGTDPKILFVGDSFTWGHGVNDNETYPYYLHTLLQNDGYHYCVINSGVQGYSFEQEYVYFQELLQTNVKPKLVIWTLENFDVTDSLTNNLLTYDHGSIKQTNMFLNPLYDEGVITSTIGKMLSNSKLINLITYNLQHEVNDEKFWKKEQEIFPVLIQKVFETARAQNIPILFVTVPNSHVLTGSSTISSEGYDYILSQLNTYQTDFVDANPVLKKATALADSNTPEANATVLGASTVQSLFLPDDIHLTASGNAVFAKIVYEKLASGGFLRH